MRTSSGPVYAAVLFLLGLHAFLAYSSLSIKSVTFDETTHLPAGLAIAERGEIRLNRQHPPLIKLAAGWAASTADPILPLDGDAYKLGKEWDFGAQVLYNPQNDRRALLNRGRLPSVGFSLLAGLVVFFWARRRAGETAALFALGLWTFSPSVLAQARWVTMDMAVTATGLCALYSWWRVCEDGASMQRNVLFGVAIGLSLASKFSGLVLLPAMVLADVLCSGRAILEPATLLSRARTWLVAAGMAWITLWSLYLFPTDPLFYFKDLARLYADLKTEYLFYLAGTFQNQRFPHYFLATYGLKSTPVELLLTVAVLMAAGHKALRRDPNLKPDLFLIVPAGAWLAATTLMASNQGHRYILMLYPLVFILAASLVPLCRTRLEARGAGRAALLLWLGLGLGQALETGLSHPDYLPYFNRLAGGPTAGPYWLDDSNVDWGQDTDRLGPWLEAKGIESVRLGLTPYAVPDLPGIRHEPLRLTDWRDGPAPGAYVLSGHVLARGLEMHQLHGYNSHWLYLYRPVDVLGNSLYLYIFESRDPVRADTAGSS